MDALFRLRVLIWVLILGLWGVMVYQYLGEEESAPAMNYVANPRQGAPLPSTPFPAEPPAAKPPPQPQPAPEPQTTLQPAPKPKAPEPAAPPPPQPSGLDFIKPNTPSEQAAAPPPEKARPPIRREGAMRERDPAIPPGFVKTPTRHFIVYSEGAPPSDEFLALLENLHGNLMLDLAAFSPWAREEKVSLFLFKNQNTYRRVTGRPAWSGGASSVPKRKMYLYESDELTGILAHELCHIYYDGFYLGGKTDPLWLSEGMATLIQVERGLAAPNWLRENLDILRHQGGYSMKDLMKVESTSGATDENVRLWYTQSYSVVRFLIRSQYKSSFYNFSRYLREGKLPAEALYRAYGMPFTNLKALEYAWRYDIGAKPR